MSAHSLNAPKIEPPPIAGPDAAKQSNGSHSMPPNPPRLREAPPFRSDDSVIKEAIAVFLQSAADEKAARQAERELNRALIEKLASGNGVSKIKTVIQTVVAVVGVVLVIGAYLVSISSDRTALMMEVQTLKEKAAKAEQVESDLRKLEKLYMVNFGKDPDEDIKQSEKKRR